MVNRVLDPRHLFPAVLRQGLVVPEPAILTVSDQTLFKYLKLTGNTEHLTWIGFGEQFTTFADIVLNAAQGLLLRLQDVDLWYRHRLEFKHLFERFYGGRASLLPAMVWVHATCWSERAIAGVFFDAEVKARTWPALREFRRNAPLVNMHFTPVALPSIGFRPAKFEWALPAGMCAKDLGWVRISENCDITSHGRPVTAYHREQLGVARCGTEFRNHLHFGLHPAQVEKAHSVFSSMNGSASFEPVRDSPFSPSTTNGKVVDDAGLLDALVLKLWRLHRQPEPGGQRAILVDELVITLERDSGRLIYVETSRDLFEWGRKNPESTAWGRWLLMNPVTGEEP